MEQLAGRGGGKVPNNWRKGWINADTETGLFGLSSGLVDYKSVDAHTCWFGSLLLKLIKNMHEDIFLQWNTTRVSYKLLSLSIDYDQKINSGMDVFFFAVGIAGMMLGAWLGLAERDIQSCWGLLRGIFRADVVGELTPLSPFHAGECYLTDCMQWNTSFSYNLFN